MNSADTAAAEVAYFRDDDQLYAAAHHLRRTRNPELRSGLLRVLAEGDRHRAGLHTAAFGEDLDDDGAPQAEWLADSARLLAILAEAEHCRGLGPEQSQWYIDWCSDDPRTVQLQIAVDHLLDRWVAGDRRPPLLRRMISAWSGQTFGDAVESVACLGTARRGFS